MLRVISSSQQRISRCTQRISHSPTRTPAILQRAKTTSTTQKSLGVEDKFVPITLRLEQILGNGQQRPHESYLATTTALKEKYARGELTFEGEETDLVGSIMVSGEKAVLGPLVITASVMNKLQHYRINTEIESKQYTEKSHVEENWNFQQEGLDTTSVVYSSSYIDEQASSGTSIDKLIERGARLLINWMDNLSRGKEHTSIYNIKQKMDIKNNGEIDSKWKHIVLHPSIKNLSTEITTRFPGCATDVDMFLAQYGHWTAQQKRKEQLQAEKSAFDQYRVGTSYVDSLNTQKYMSTYKESSDEEREGMLPLRMSNESVKDFFSGKLVFELPVESSDELNQALSELGGVYTNNKTIENDLLLKNL